MWLARQIKYLSKSAKKIKEKEGYYSLFNRVIEYLTNRVKNDVHKLLAFSHHVPLFGLDMEKDNRDIGVHKYTYVRYDAHTKFDYGSEVIPRPSDNVVEVGIWNGYDTAKFAKLSNQVIAFEASLRNYQRSKKILKILIM